jgi:hypothetical protein
MGLYYRSITLLRFSPEERRNVIDKYFWEDILDLQDLIRRDLSAWLGRNGGSNAAPGAT